MTVKKYKKVGLRRHPKRFLVSVHKIVLEAFIGPAPSPKHECCHNNGIHADNRTENLRWGTTKDNGADKTKHGTVDGERNPAAVLTESDVLEIKRRLASGETLKSIAADYGVSFSLISGIKRGIVWKHVESNGKPKEAPF